VAADDEHFVTLAWRVLYNTIQSQSVMDGQTEIQTDASAIAKTSEALHVAA